MDARARNRLTAFAAFFGLVFAGGTLTLTGEALGYVTPLSPIAKLGVAWTAAFGLVMGGIVAMIFRAAARTKG